MRARPPVSAAAPGARASARPPSTKGRRRGPCGGAPRRAHAARRQTKYTPMRGAGTRPAARRGVPRRSTASPRRRRPCA
eukprot:360590-Chlamydomonas_euryale.AAC.2